MAKHMVKCVYCGKMFDTNGEAFIKVNGTRYAHQSCHEQNFNNKSKEEQDYVFLSDYIKKLFDGKPSQRVWKQIRDFKEKDGFTYSGMLKTLQWWYEVKGNSIDKANGACGIIPYVYNEAMQYYYALYLLQTINKDEQVEKARIGQVREFIIEAPKIDRPAQRLFKLEEEEE